MYTLQATLARKVAYLLFFVVERVLLVIWQIYEDSFFYKPKNYECRVTRNMPFSSIVTGRIEITVAISSDHSPLSFKRKKQESRLTWMHLLWVWSLVLHGDRWLGSWVEHSCGSLEGGSCLRLLQDMSGP